MSKKICPVADDKVWVQTNRFLEKQITIEEFVTIVKVYEDFIQYCLVTEKAITWLKRIDH